MNNIITCKNCGTEIEISEAFAHQMEERVKKALSADHAKELEQVKKASEEAALEKIKKDFESQLRSSNKEKEEEKERVTKLLREQEVLQDEKRKLIRKDEERNLEMKKKLMEEEEKIRHEATKKAEEAQDMKIKERELVIEQLKKSLEDAQRKASQGSQQLQGEVLELDLEEKLKKLFPTDDIQEVKKGELGADIRHIVKTDRGTVCGVILWESKRTKTWSDSWLTKLKEDAHKDKAHIAALISEVLPVNFLKGIENINGVWVAGPKFLELLAIFLRRNLIDVARERHIASNKQSKAEDLYDYITSQNFIHQLEQMVEAYLDMKHQITRERVSMERSLKQREVQVDRLLSGVSGMYGSMQGIAGSSLPHIRQLHSGEEEADEIEE